MEGYAFSGFDKRLLNDSVEEYNSATFEFVVRMRRLLRLKGSRLEMIFVRSETVQSKVTGIQRVVGRFRPGKEDRRTFIVGVMAGDLVVKCRLGLAGDTFNEEELRVLFDRSRVFYSGSFVFTNEAVEGRYYNKQNDDAD